MGFGGGGGGALPAHVHNSVPLQGGPLDFANDTIASLNAGSTTFSSGAALQELVIGNPADSLVVNAGGTAPEWVAAAGGQTFGRGVKKVTELIQNDSTLTDDNDLIIAVNANKTYGFLLMLAISTDVLPAFKYAFSLPVGGSGSMIADVWDSTTPNVIADATTARTIAAAPGEIEFTIPVVGKFEIAGTAGNIALQWAQDVSNAGNTRLHAGSYFVLWEETS